MKKVLITGKDSYIGVALENWLNKELGKYKVTTVDMKNELWRDEDWSTYDVVYHVAGIAHIKETNSNKDIYYKINRDMAYETAVKAKKDGIQHFIFLSSMSVYGIDNGIIDRTTVLKPKSNYGKSKKEAEDLINRLYDDSFTVAIVRPPMVYGKGCKGNYPKLAKLAVKTPIFPKVNNNRSMIYIDNLSEFTKLIIDNKCAGVYFPQNSEYINTSEMVKLISEIHKKRILITTYFNPLLRLFNRSIVNKIFGNLVYDMSISEYKYNYRVCGFRESIFYIEGS